MMHKAKAKGSHLLVLALCLMAPPLLEANSTVVGPDCTVKGKKLYGKVKAVDSFPDLKVQVVSAFPDLKVKVVTAFPDSCGKWQMVDSFPDLKVQFVTAFPDVKIQYVDAFPGRP
jgi:hypothetical protein